MMAGGQRDRLYDRDYQELKEDIQDIRACVHELKHCLMGNGRPGVMTRLALLESEYTRWRRLNITLHGTLLAAVLALVGRLIWQATAG